VDSVSDAVDAEHADQPCGQQDQRNFQKHLASAPQPNRGRRLLGHGQNGVHDTGGSSAGVRLSESGAVPIHAKRCEGGHCTART
jgi:hypothetical protein